MLTKEKAAINKVGGIIRAIRLPTDVHLAYVRTETHIRLHVDLEPGS